jgi:putative ATP-dependent endonuclease of the OLD family
MRIARVKIGNFRGISEAEIPFSGHTVLVGDNNSGKSTVLEALDLVLGPGAPGNGFVPGGFDFFRNSFFRASF